MFNGAEIKALENLLEAASENTALGSRVAHFLRFWWHARNRNNFSTYDLWALDEGLARDAITVFVAIVSNKRVYPETLGYQKEFERIIDLHC